jgi:hypothetical protein
MLKSPFEKFYFRSFAKTILTFCLSSFIEQVKIGIPLFTFPVRLKAGGLHGPANEDGQDDIEGSTFVFIFHYYPQSFNFDSHHCLI